MNSLYLQKTSSVLLKQKGITLIVALVMLLIMTSLGVTTITGSTLQERMANNSRQNFVARLNAEAALREAEDYLLSLNLNTMQPNDLAAQIAQVNGFFAPTQLGSIAPSSLPNGFNVVNDASWFTDDGDATNDVGVVPANIQNEGAFSPRYIIEYLGRFDEYGTGRIQEINSQALDNKPYIFRIRSIGWGNNANAVSVLQSYYISQ